MSDRCGIDDPWLHAHRRDREHWPEARQRLAAIFLTRSRDEWCGLLEGSDACVTPVLTMAEATSHAHATERAAYVQLGGVVQPAPAPRLDRTPAAITTLPPLVGEHSEAILREWGFKESEIEAALSTGLVQTVRPPGSSQPNANH